MIIGAGGVTIFFLSFNLGSILYSYFLYVYVFFLVCFPDTTFWGDI